VHSASIISSTTVEMGSRTYALSTIAQYAAALAAVIMARRRSWRESWPMYIVSATVLGLSILVSLLIPEAYRGMASIPGIGALLSILVQAWRDQLDYDRRLGLQVHQQDFTLGIASQMASTAYSKHLEFCEVYSEKLHQGLNKLFNDGPSPYAFELASSLKAIRSKYAVWLSEDLQENLFPFEQALRDVGAAMTFAKHTQVSDARSKAVEEAAESYDIFIGLTQPETEGDAEKSTRRVLENLRKILGIQELTALRQRAIADARARITPHRG
jgi:hypothetical protein